MSLFDALLLDGVRLNFWLAIRTDGIAGSGSQTDPFNASSGQFDAVMVKVLALPDAQNTAISIYLGPGVFQTKGYRTDTDTSLSGWQPKAGMKIIGSGIEVTTIQLINVVVAGAHYCALGHALTVTTQANYCEISELSIDCNLSSASTGVACGAIRLMGSHARIRRVRAWNWGAKSGAPPCFVFSLITATAGAGGIQTVDAGMEDCLANDPASGGNLNRVTAFHAGGKEDVAQPSAEAFGTGPFIRNCFVDAGVTTPSKAGNYVGLSMGWCRLGIVEGNQIHNFDIGGPHQDKASSRDLVVRDNFYRNVARGPFWSLGQVSSDDIESGTPGLTRSGTIATIPLPTNHGLLAADRIKVVTSESSFNGMRQVTGVGATSVSYACASTDPSGATVSSVRKVYGVGKLLVEDNYFELTAGASPVAIELNDNGTAIAPDYAQGEVIIRGNRIRYVDGIVPITVTDVFIVVNGAKNVILGNNIFESTNLNPIQSARCGTVTAYNNLDPVQFATEAEDALVMSLFNRRVR